MKTSKTFVVALGGNAFMQKGRRNTVEEQWRNVETAAKQIVELYESGNKVVVTHGNGPQVGVILEWMESLKDKHQPLTMDIATAMTQGWLGYMLMQKIGNLMVKRGHERKVVAIINQVLVDKKDEAFRNPTKFVGSYYTREEADKLSKTKGWIFKQDPRGGYRRVVPSPNPLLNIETDVVRTLLDNGYIVIASGGGGIPVFQDDSNLRGVEAVIDKDLASEILATAIKADFFIIATDVDGVYLNYGTESAELIRKISLREIKELYGRGVFPPGSMGPKVLACIRFVERTGNNAIITSLNKLIVAVRGEAGTHITP